MYTVALAITLLLHGLMLCRGEPLANSSIPRMILVSFDGFRADYLLNHSLPNLQNFINDGVSVIEVKNVFITKTFPNHYSLVTGLYAESHGIVANSMFDPVSNQTFDLSNSSLKTDPVWWNEATPIWVTNQRAGRRSGSAMWPGSDVRIQNTTLSEFLPYDRKVTFVERVDKIISWFTRADDPVNFATLYFEEPDASGHRFGPENKDNMTAVLKSVDEDIGYLVSALKEKNLWDTVNIIITSDHGMAQCSKKRVIVLDQCIGRGSYVLVDSTPVAAILPLKDCKMIPICSGRGPKKQPCSPLYTFSMPVTYNSQGDSCIRVKYPLSDVKSVYDLLKNCSDHMKAYLKEDIPDRYHYKHNSRIQPIILVADEGWTIVQNESSPISLGNHGYDNDLASMHPFLAAHGPAFHKNHKIRTMNSVDLYPMMCHILRLKPEPNNGTLSSTKCLLVDQWCIQLPEAIGIVMGAIMVLTTLTCIVMLLKKKLPSPRQFSRLEFQEDDDPLIG